MMLIQMESAVSVAPGIGSQLPIRRRANHDHDSGRSENSEGQKTES